MAPTLRKRIKQSGDEEKENVDGGGVVMPQRTKRSAKTRGNAGRLANLLDMPMDVLFEIFGHLNPLDLLRLARMTKEFRRVLMHRSSISIWRAARAHITDLPDIFPGMAEPAWANLVYDPHCHFCASSIVHNVEWQWRTRICKKCVKDNVIDYAEGFERAHHEVRDVYEHLSSLIPQRLNKKKEVEFLIRDFDETMETLWVAALSENSMEATELWFEERQKVIDTLIEHATLCEEWAEMRAENRSTELEKLRTERVEAITKKLVDLGWGDELASMDQSEQDDFLELKVVKQAHALTDRIWKNIETDLVAYMYDVQARRLSDERMMLVNTRRFIAIEILGGLKKAALPFTDIFPGPFDWCSIAPIKAIIDQPSEVNVDLGSFGNLDFATLLTEWRLSLRDDLCAIVRVAEEERNILREVSDDKDGQSRAKLDKSDALDHLKLATTIFGCERCVLRQTHHPFGMPGRSSSRGRRLGQPMFYPEVMGHHCLTDSPRERWEDRFEGEMLDISCHRSGASRFHRQRWNARSLWLDLELGRMAFNVVKAAEMNPYTGTAEEMDRLDVRLICGACLNKNQEDPEDEGNYRLKGFSPIIFPMGWRKAIEHNAKYHPKSPVDWIPIDENSENYNWDAVVFKTPKALVFCVHCCDTPDEPRSTDLAHMKQHLADTHNVSTPVLNIDYAANFEASPLVTRSQGWFKAKAREIE